MGGGCGPQGRGGSYLSKTCLLQTGEHRTEAGSRSLSSSAQKWQRECPTAQTRAGDILNAQGTGLTRQELKRPQHPEGPERGHEAALGFVTALPQRGPGRADRSASCCFSGDTPYCCQWGRKCQHMWPQGQWGWGPCPPGVARFSFQLCCLYRKSASEDRCVFQQPPVC